MHRSIASSELRFSAAILIFLMTGVSKVSSATTCQKEHAQEKKDTRAAIEKLRKTIPQTLIGPMVESGKCTIRALKLGITAGFDKDYSNAVDLPLIFHPAAVRISGICVPVWAG